LKSDAAPKVTAGIHSELQTPNSELSLPVPNARLIIDQLRSAGITHVVALPDNTSKALLEGLAGRPDIRVVGVTREGEAWAVAAGLWIGGGAPAVLIQNTGFLESGDALRGTAMRMRIPVLCLLTYRGYATLPAASRLSLEFGVSGSGLKSDAHNRAPLSTAPSAFNPEPKTQNPKPGVGASPWPQIDGQILSRPDVDSCAVVFEPTLRAWGVPYDFLHDDADVGKIRATLDLARQRQQPAALLLTQDTT
jgi:hypothetical protein